MIENQNKILKRAIELGKNEESAGDKP